MYGYIILRDVSKEEVQLDFSIFEIQGGFRGFAQVPPGPHYVAIKDRGQMEGGFWCFVESSSVVVKIYDYQEKRFERDLENEEHYSSLALSGTMNRALIPVMIRDGKAQALWQGLVSHVKKEGFPPTLHEEEPMSPPLELSPEQLSDWYETKFKSRFEQAFLESHQGNVSRFLAEFQFAFVRLLLDQRDQEAFERWRNLLQAIYGAGEQMMVKESKLFTYIVDSIINQFNLLSRDYFQKDSFVIHEMDYFMEDLRDTGNQALIAKATELEQQSLLRSNS